MSERATEKRDTIKRRWWILVVLCVSLVMVGLDNTILNVALPTLVRALHASSSQLQWIVDAYSVVFGSLLLTGGSFGDRIGRKTTFIVGLVVFGTGSAASAFSGTADQLIAARLFMGVGGALVMPSTLSILINVFTVPHERARAIGIWSGTTGVGVAIGPILGGWLLSHFWWGSVFLVNVPIVILGLAASLWIVPNSSDPRASKPDPIGSLVSMAGLGSLLWAIIEAPVHGWRALETIAAFAIGILLIGSFLAWELHTSHPMLQMSFFKKARFSAANASITMVFFALFGSMFMITQYLQFVMGYSPLKAGVMILPVSVVLGLAAPLSISVERKAGTKIVVAAGLLLISYGLWDLSDLTVSSHYSTILIPLIMLGAGMGFAMAPATESIMGSLPPDKAGIGSATNGTMIQVGGSLGVAVLGSVEATRYVDHVNQLMHGHAVPAQAAQAIRSSIGGALAVAHLAGGAIGKVLASSAKVGFTNGMSNAVLVGAMVTVVGAIVALLFLPSRAQETASGSRMIQKGSVTLAQSNNAPVSHLLPTEDIVLDQPAHDPSMDEPAHQPLHHSQT